MNITPINQALVEAGFIPRPTISTPIQQALIDTGFITYWNEPLTVRERFLVSRYICQLSAKTVLLEHHRTMARFFAANFIELVNQLKKGTL